MLSHRYKDPQIIYSPIRHIDVFAGILTFTFICTTVLDYSFLGLLFVDKRIICKEYPKRKKEQEIATHTHTRTRTHEQKPLDTDYNDLNNSLLFFAFVLNK